MPGPHVNDEQRHETGGLGVKMVSLFWSASYRCASDPA